MWINNFPICETCVNFCDVRQDSTRRFAFISFSLINRTDIIMCRLIFEKGKETKGYTHKSDTCVLGLYR